MGKIFSGKFMATGDNQDITYINFNHLGLYKKEVFDAKGDLIVVEFYKDYDYTNDIFSNLAVKEERTYTRDATTGLIVRRDTTITWYDELGAIITQRTGIEKVYTFQKGFVSNKRARQNLLDKASLYFYTQLLTNAAGDTSVADTQKNEFDAFTDKEQSLYIKSTIQPLIDKINNASDVNHVDYKPYMTAAMAATMVGILNINYDGV